MQEWEDGILRRPAGDSTIQLLRTGQCLPDSLCLCADDDWLELFELATWENGYPVYTSRGYTPQL